jgi:hypothetical protein
MTATRQRSPCIDRVVDFAGKSSAARVSINSTATGKANKQAKKIKI